MHIIGVRWKLVTILHIWCMITESLSERAVVSFYQVMPTYHNSTGKKAYIMNMYTAPEYRRQGIAFHTLDLLVNDAKEQGVLQIALEATDMGRPLYERYGFVKMEDEMKLKV